MNDKSQIEYHANKPIHLDCTIHVTADGYQAECPDCAWTSGINLSEVTSLRLYYQHLEYVERTKCLTKTIGR